MENVLVELAVSMSDFKKNPAAVLRQAQGRPVAVLNHNKVAFYMLEPGLLQHVLRALAQTASPPGPADPGDAARDSRGLLERFLSQAHGAARESPTI